MYCPRCGAPNTETTKFCRQCGLALTQVSSYVASGGTGQLVQPPMFSPVEKTVGDLKQKLVLTLMILVLAPGIFAVLGKVLGLEEIGKGLAALSSVLMPINIVWAIFHYKAQKRRLQYQQWQQVPPAATFTPPGNLQPQPSQPPLQSPPTNPLANPATPLAAPVIGSVTEDETRRFPG